MFRYSSDTMRSPIDGSKKRKEKPLKTYSCDLCHHSKWQNETDVEIHRKDVHKNTLYKSVNDKNNHFCRICVRQFRDDAAVLRHIKSIHLLSSPTAPRIEREIFICDYCNNIFFNKRLLSAHISHTHSPKHCKFKERIECPVCFKMLKLQTVWSHFLYHKIHSVSTCQICLKTCESKSELREHLKSHPYYYNCDVCGFQSKYSSTYYQHTVTHKTNVGQNVCLDNVNGYFASRYNVTWKYELDPTGLKGLRIPKNIKICVLCREICKEQAMEEHMLMDHCIEEESKKKHLCVCGEEFFNNVLLKHHIFKLKGRHAIVSDEMDQESLLIKAYENDEVVDNCEDISNDEELILKRQEVPIEYVGVHKERAIASNIACLVQTEDVIDQHDNDEEDNDNNDVMIDNYEVNNDNNEVVIDNDEVNNDNVELIIDNVVVNNDNGADSENVEIDNQIVVQNVGNSQHLDLSDEHVEVVIQWT